MAKIQYNFRIDPDKIERLKEIAEFESNETGFNIDVSAIVRKAIDKMIDEYK